MKLISREKTKILNDIPREKMLKNTLLDEKIINDITTLAENLRAIRAILDLSCETLANYLGTTKQTISNIELYKAMNVCQYISIRKIIDILFEDLGYNTPKVKACLQLLNEDTDRYMPDSWMDRYFKCVSHKK